MGEDRVQGLFRDVGAAPDLPPRTERPRADPRWARDPQRISVPERGIALQVTRFSTPLRTGYQERVAWQDDDGLCAIRLYHEPRPGLALYAGRRRIQLWLEGGEWVNPRGRVLTEAQARLLERAPEMLGLAGIGMPAGWPAYRARSPGATRAEAATAESFAALGALRENLEHLGGAVASRERQELLRFRARVEAYPALQECLVDWRQGGRLYQLIAQHEGRIAHLRAVVVRGYPRVRSALAKLEGEIAGLPEARRAEIGERIVRELAALPTTRPLLGNLAVRAAQGKGPLATLLGHPKFADKVAKVGDGLAGALALVGSEARVFFQWAARRWLPPHLHHAAAELLRGLEGARDVTWFKEFFTRRWPNAAMQSTPATGAIKVFGNLLGTYALGFYTVRALSGEDPWMNVPRAVKEAVNLTGEGAQFLHDFWKSLGIANEKTLRFWQGLAQTLKGGVLVLGAGLEIGDFYRRGIDQSDRAYAATLSVMLGEALLAVPEPGLTKVIGGALWIAGQILKSMIPHPDVETMIERRLLHCRG